MKHRSELAYLLNDYGLLGVGAEVGVRAGQFSEVLLRRWKGGPLVMVDAWTPHLPDYHGDSAGLASEGTMQKWEAEARARAKMVGERAAVCKMLSSEAAAAFADGHFDFIYLDCNHGYDAAGRWGIVQDLRLWWPKLRPGGVFSGHDYFLARCKPNGAPEIVDREEDADIKAYGVKKAADEFAATVGAEVLATTHDKFASWFWVKQ